MRSSARRRAFFSFGFVNVSRLDGHVGENGHSVAGDLCKTAADREEIILVVLPHDYFARHDLRHERDVPWKNTQFALGAGSVTISTSSE
jgi:hypothetical protein